MKRKSSTESDKKSIFCKYLRDRNYTLSEIATVLNIHHSTVIHHLRKYNGLIMFDKKFKQNVADFKIDDYVRNNDLSSKIRDIVLPEQLSKFLIH